MPNTTIRLPYFPGGSGAHCRLQYPLSIRNFVEFLGKHVASDGNIVRNNWVDIRKKTTMMRINILNQVVAGFFYTLRKEWLHIPPLILGSKLDKIVCVECLEKTHKVFWEQIARHESTGHCIHLEEPGWASEEIKKWIKRINLL